MSSSELGGEGPLPNVSVQYGKLQRQYQQILDRWTPFVLYRWLSTVGLLLLFMLRILLAQGVSSRLPVVLCLADIKLCSGTLVSILYHERNQNLTAISILRRNSVLSVHFVSFCRCPPSQPLLSRRCPRHIPTQPPPRLPATKIRPVTPGRPISRRNRRRRR